MIVCDNKCTFEYLDIDAAITHCTKGIVSGVRPATIRAEPDVVTCAGAFHQGSARVLRAAQSFDQDSFHQRLDLFKLQSDREHPHV